MLLHKHKKISKRWFKPVAGVAPAAVSGATPATGLISKRWFKLFLMPVCCLLVSFSQSNAQLAVSITASAATITPGDSISFFDQSTGSPNQWLWTFPGGTPSSSTSQNPVVNYSNEGAYDVTLNIKDGIGGDVTLTFTNYIKVDSMKTFWWNDAVFYEVFVRSFKDNNGDGQGDLKGLISKLDYLNDGKSSTKTDLGVTGLWLMPIHQSPSYHGYDVTDYRTVEQDYGTNADFKTLITEAHKRGIKVIIDYVMNHTSSQHPWFTASTNPLDPKRNWYVWQNPKPLMTGPWGQTVWYPLNASNYYAIFWSGMPDLNYTTPEVKTEMFDVARFWLQDMNVDGFRLDAVKYVIENGTTLQDTPETIAFWKDFSTFYKTAKTDAYAIGEAWSSTSIAKQYVNGNALDNCFEFDMASAIVAASNSGNTTALKSQIDTVMASYPFLQFGSFLTNHDMNRVMDQLGNSTSKAKLASSLLLTLPGVPYIYYGEEIGMNGSGVDENKRTPLQWTSTAQAGFTTGTPWRPVNSDYKTKNITTQKGDATSLWNNYRKLISIRNSEAALRRGNYQSVSASTTSVVAFLRQYGDENVLVISNTSSGAVSNVLLNLTQGGIIPGPYQLLELQGVDQLPLTIDNTGGFSNLSIAQIPAQSTLIYKLNSTLTGVESQLGASNTVVYPVPTNKELFIKYSNVITGLVHYKITDLIGAERMSSSFMATSQVVQHSLSCETLPSGVYLLTIEYNGTTEVSRIIVQK